jgi:predicted nucleotidyltransferase
VDWALREAPRHQGLLRLGFYGSYARGDWGVGSDVDLVAVVTETAVPFERRAVEWDLSSLPVPADLVVYTRAEWDRLGQEGGRFARMLVSAAVWLTEEGAATAGGASR